VLADDHVDSGEAVEAERVPGAQRGIENLPVESAELGRAAPRSAFTLVRDANSPA